jgi:hypothetical protein
MSTLPATNKGFGFTSYADPNASKEAAASAHITEHEQDVR